MASIYDKSSLVLIPSGTKAGKVYSQKPVSGDGDFTFTRSSAATRVNASGNIEKETQNLSLYSNTFSSWTAASGGSVTSGQAGYDGTSDAWLLTSGAATYSRIERTISHTGLYTISVYAKAGTLGWLSFENSGISSDESYFDLTTGTLGSLGANVISANIESIGSGWYRCSATLSGTSATQRIYPAVGNGDLNSAQGNIYIQDFQFEQGLVARDYIETTTSAVYGGITDNVPRLDYTDSSCPALLLEPQRTNLITQSEYFNSSYWIKGGLPVFSVSDNAGISPEGVSNATRFVAASAQQSTRLYTSVTWTAVPYTISLYVKNNGGTNTNLRFSYYDGSGQYFSPTFTLTDEWQRIEYTFTPTASSGGFWLVNTPTAGLNLDLLVFAAQLEEGSYATSYIPTYGSSVTRVVDSCLDGGDSNVFDNDTAVWFMDIERIGTDSAIIGDSLSLRDNSNVRQITLWFDAPTKQIRFRDGKNSFTTIGSSGGAISTPDNTRIKIALKIDGTTLKVFADGVQKGSNYTRPTAFDITQMDMDGKGYKIRNIKFLNSTLTDQELADLTTL